MTEKTKDFINAVESEDYTNSADAFKAVMSSKLNDALENKKIEIAQSMADKAQETQQDA